MDKTMLDEILKKNKWFNDESDERANLGNANLRGANLQGADLRGADLQSALGTFAVGQFGKQQAIAAGGFISIGCEHHTYQDWLDNYEQIGQDNNYTEAEIARYGAWIKLVVEWLSDAEKEEQK